MVEVVVSFAVTSPSHGDGEGEGGRVVASGPTPLSIPALRMPKVGSSRKPGNYDKCQLASEAWL